MKINHKSNLKNKFYRLFLILKLLEIGLLVVQKHVISQLLRQSIILLIITSIVLSSCVTFHSPDFYNVKNNNYLANPVCVHLDFYTDELGIIDTTTAPKKLNSIDLYKYQSTLKKYNINTDCDKPIASYEVWIGDRTEHATIKGVLPFITLLTLGIVPTFLNIKSQITLLKNDKVVTQNNLNEDKAVWIGFVFKQTSDDAKLKEAYDASAMFAMVNREICEMIVADLTKQNKDLKP